MEISNSKLLETYVKADYSDKQTLERLLGKEIFSTINDYEILSYYMPDMSKGSHYHLQKASCFLDSQFGGNSEWKIYSIKRLYDNKVFTLEDYLNLNNLGKATLKEIQFEIAPADKGTKKLCFVTDHKTLGKWWSISQLEHTTKPLFTTHDDVEIDIDTEYYIVNDEYFLCTDNGKPFKAMEGTTMNKDDKYFYNKGNALDYIKLHDSLVSVQVLLGKQSYLCYGELVKSMIK